jgi:DNA-binding CsgD family transcriptional regulator
LIHGAGDIICLEQRPELYGFYMTTATENKLSEREQEILSLVATGASNKEIAKELYISTNTVKVHLRNIFGKIGVNSRTEAAMYAVNTGLVPGIHQNTEPDEGGNKAPTLRRRILSLPVFILIITALILGFSILTISIWQSAQTTPQDPNRVEVDKKWEKLSPMITSRSGLAVAVYENWIYSFAGQTSLEVSNKTERYFPEADIWETVNPKPTPVKDIGAAVIGNLVYIPGGTLSTGQVTDVLEIYDPRTDTWTQGAVVPQPLSAYAISTLEGKLYLFGGWDGKNFVSSVYQYSPDDNHWTILTPLSTARAYAGAVTAGGKIYLMGGYDGKKSLDLNEVYTPSLDTGGESPWENSTPLPGGRYKMGIVSVTDVIYLVGGINDVGNDLSSLGFFPQTEEWQDFGDESTQSGSDLGLSTVGTNIYAMGGEIDKNPLANNLSYQVLYRVVLPIIP